MKGSTITGFLAFCILMWLMAVINIITDGACDEQSASSPRFIQIHPRPR